MEFTTTVSDLLLAISSSASVVPTKSAALVAYTGVHLTVKDTTLYVAATDGEVSVTTHIEVTNPQKGSALVVPKQLMRWLSKAPKSAKVTVSDKTAGKLEVELEGSASPYSFNTMVATFPSQSATLQADKEVDLSNLPAAITAVKDVAGEVVAGSGQTALQLVFSNGKLLINATDHIRITQASLPTAEMDPASVLVETKALEIVKNLRSTHVGFDKSYRTIVFSGPGHKVTVRTLDAPFAPVESILSEEPPHKVRVSKEVLVDAVERLSCVADESATLVMELDGSTLKLAASSSAVGAGTEEVELNSPVPVPTTIAVNIFYMQQATKNNPNDELVISWSSPLTPVFVHSSGDLDVTSVVMPIRLND